MNPQSAIAKGKELENFIVEELRGSGLDPRAYRQKGSGNGLNKGDIWNALDIHFECKNTAKFGGKEWFKQMADDNVGHMPEILIWHMPGTSIENSKAIIDWQYLKELLIGNKGASSLLDAPDLKWPINNLKEAANKVLKLLP